MREFLDLLESAEGVEVIISFDRTEQAFFVEARKGERQSRYMITKEMIDDDPGHFTTFAERAIRKVS